MKYYQLKRAMDIVMSLILIPILFPVMVIFAVLIFLEDFHSPFYIPIRYGKDKKQFRFYKFRTMIKDAEKMVKKGTIFYKYMRSGKNKMEDDPRITRIGKFVRKYSIDELLQLFNVLKGDMSLVGPRALMVDEYEEYAGRSPENARKLRIISTVKPGITGYWQVNGRSSTDFDTRIDMDVYYAQNMSLLFDLKIILKTPLAVISAKGAY